MMTGSSIQIANRLYPLTHLATGKEIPVRRWNDWDYPVVPEFKAGDGYNKKRVKPINLMVWHWTGGEQDPIAMAEVLRHLAACGVTPIEPPSSRAGALGEILSVYIRDPEGNLIEISNPAGEGYRPTAV